MDLDRTALLLVDIQKGFHDATFWGPRSNPSFERNVTILLQALRSIHDTTISKPLIIHVYHVSANPSSPLHPSSHGSTFQDYASPLSSEIVVSKTVNSAFIGTRLEDILREHEIRRLYVIGLTTDHCVSTTVRMAGNLGVTDWIDGDGSTRKGDGVFLVSDATAAHAKGEFEAELVHAVHAESLKEFAEVVTTEEVLRSLAQAVDDEQA